MSKEPVELAEILQSIVAQAGGLELQEEMQIQNNWELVVGPQLSKIVHAASWQNKVLKVKVLQAAWKTDVYYRLTELQKKFNQVFPELKLKKMEIL